MGAALVAGVALLVGGAGHSAEKSQPAQAAKSAAPFAVNSDEFAARVGPFVTAYCGDCHSGAKPEAKLDLTQYHDTAGALHDRRVWRTALAKLRAHEMPPADQTQPSAAERGAVIQWIDEQLAKPVAFAAQNPGRVTIRRLNRAEYNNTIRDLVGVEFHPADDFPADDVGYGFDNIGDVLAMSPLLMEKYFDAAERIMGEAIIVPTDRPVIPIKTFNVMEMTATPPDPSIRFGGVRRLIANGDLHISWNVTRAGDYRLSVRAFGRKVGDEVPKMSIRLDGEELKAFDVKTERKNPGLYEVVTALKRGEHRVAIAFTNPFTDDKAKDPRQKDRTLFVATLETKGPLDAKNPDSYPESHRKIIFCPPSSAHPSPEERAECAKKVLKKFATRAFRRPATDEELGRLMKLFEAANKEGDPLERSLQTALEAVLVSPYFLFRVELDPDPSKPQLTRPLNDYELASRLSYFLWNSMPDDELASLCDRGALRKDGNLESQTRRMLKDPKIQGLVDNFGGQWLQTRRLAAATPDKSAYPQFDDSLRADMKTETETFFAHVASDDRSILDFIDAEYTWANGRLAKFYGISGVEGDDFRRVSLAGAHRSGVFTQASILTITSNPSRTSPVKRGKWVLETLLGAAPPPPPADVPPLAEDKKTALTGTVRQRTEQHRANAICASCHKSMDPLGFALEHFDPIGGYREKDGPLPVDASGSLPGGQKFEGADGLRDVLRARQDQFCRCLSEKLLTYALGRGLEDYDEAAVDGIAHTAARNDYRFSSLIIEIVRSAPFQLRRTTK